MPEPDAPIVARTRSSDRRTAQVERLIRGLEAATPVAGSSSATQLRQMMDRPAVEPDDGNTPFNSADHDQDDDNDAARV